MSLLDTIDGSFMNFAYGWAFSKPVRKVFYNITITGLSVAVALVIGTIELGGLLASQLDLSGSFWSWFENININLLGFVIVGMFVATWAIALSVWRFGRIEERWTRAPRRPLSATAQEIVAALAAPHRRRSCEDSQRFGPRPHEQRGSMLQPAIAATALVLAASAATTGTRSSDSCYWSSSSAGSSITSCAGAGWRGNGRTRSAELGFEGVGARSPRRSVWAPQEAVGLSRKSDIQ